jgi:hypothetical protein
MVWRLLAPFALAGGVALGTPTPAPLPPSSLAVRANDGSWREWWNSATAPSRWERADSVLGSQLAWRRVGPGVEWSETRLSGSGEAWRLRLIVVRIDPRMAAISLDTAFTRGRARAAWSIDDAPSDALVALNAGQFGRSLPWGWVQLNGREFLSAGRGPLSSGFAIDSSGGVRWIRGDAILDPVTRRGAIYGFQSYPTLLSSGGEVPTALRSPGNGIDLEHRDARLAIGGTSDGRVLVALTRFDGAGAALDFVPFGLTTPEMAAVMGALGARDAVMLDGGISSQLRIRDPAGLRRWTGMRSVPLSLIVRARITQ